MEAIAVRLPPGERWTYLCGESGAKKPADVVVRAFEHALLAAVGTGERGPDTEPVLVRPGEGRRLVGQHFFARPADPVQGSLVTYRGL